MKTMARQGQLFNIYESKRFLTPFGLRNGLAKAAFRMPALACGAAAIIPADGGGGARPRGDGEAEAA